MELTQDRLHAALRDFARAMVDNKIAPSDALADLQLHEAGVTDWIGEWIHQAEMKETKHTIRFWTVADHGARSIKDTECIQVEVWDRHTLVCEFRIAWMWLCEEAPTARVRLFCDAWKALTLCPAVFSSLVEAADEKKTAPQDIVNRLLALGAETVPT